MADSTNAAFQPEASSGIRRARPDDAPSIAAIYNHYVVHTSITFEEEPISTAEMADRIRDVGAVGEWLVADGPESVVGYAYAKPFAVRAAYRHTFESTIYLHPEQTGRGLGRLLYAALLGALGPLDVHRIIGVIALPNDASVRLHERLGFTPAGRLGEVGRKFDRWIDTGYWIRPLSGA